jgi:hypothetical protein
MRYVKTMKLNAHEAITLEHHGYQLILKDFGQMIWEVYKYEEKEDKEQKEERHDS